ncbi:MAG TPA: phage tail sheath C-terminal domain-containing protein [Thermoanaerobaculia bacterium]|jgi:hypothetical protein|nr:phage tail sheath C-terminal domain-containing protein [Thermoanaerobaculia bacterium]
MPVQPTYPGVYIEEIPSGVRTISGVATSVAAFIGQFRRGPLDQPVQLFNLGDFERELGGLLTDSEASYAIQQFFLNGGTEAWAVRVAGGNSALPASVTIKGDDGTDALTVTAVSPGVWGNDLRVAIDHVDPKLPTDQFFNLTVSEVSAGGRTEVFRNLSMKSTDPSFVDTVVNAGSKLVQVGVVSGATKLPVQNGTVSGDLPAQLSMATSPPSSPQLNVTIGTSGPFKATLAGAPTTLSEARSFLESAIRAASPADPAFAGATVQVVAKKNLRILAGPTDAGAKVTFTAATSPPDNTLSALQLGGVIPNVQLYGLANGSDGTAPDGTAFIGDLNTKKGIYALENVDLFNILCIPEAAKGLDENTANSVMATAIAYCEKRRAMFLMDTPDKKTSVQDIKEWLAGNGISPSKNAALYFPRVQVGDPLNGFALRSFGASGTIAGLYARIDASRGVWKAPAGTEATLTNVQALDAKLSDAENGALNPLAINTLRNFPVYGNVCWGARTLMGADQIASEWKYVPVRRLALFLEESLYRGTQWVVFEPNDEPLWAQIRLNIGAFMHTLFRQGAFQGKSPRDAYLVKCDSETTTQDDINRGVVNILVGFAPLKPAEFVILQIQQLAGQIQT